jgi:hypothetical protein
LAAFALGSQPYLARLALGLGVPCLPRILFQGYRLVADVLHFINLIGSSDGATHCVIADEHALIHAAVLTRPVATESGAIEIDVLTAPGARTDLTSPHDAAKFDALLAWNREWCFHSPQYAAIQAKLNNQAAYAVWRQDVAVQGRHISGPKDELPATTDPGAVVIYRWRRRHKAQRTICAGVLRLTSEGLWRSAKLAS